MHPFGRPIFAALAFALLCTSVQAAGIPAIEIVKRALGDPAGRDALVREGRNIATFCANCHGDAGLSRFPDVPNLAKQHPEYILHQIDAFVTGKRKNEFMEKLMRVLDERDKAAIALAYASAPPVVAAATPGPRAAEGREQYRRLCAQCHQADAHGTESIPRLAGQQPEYLRMTLRRYLNQSGERMYPPMTAAVKQLGDQNIDAVADYLSSLK